MIKEIKGRTIVDVREENGSRGKCLVIKLDDGSDLKIGIGKWQGEQLETTVWLREIRVWSVTNGTKTSRPAGW